MKIPKEISMLILDKLLKPERRKELKGADWPKEISSVNKLYNSYPELEFWIKLNIFQVNSCVFFKGENGKAEIEKQWRIFLFDKSIEAKKQKEVKSEVDPDVNPASMTESKIQPKQNLLDWIDN